MSILVSGGAGYIGSHTCVELLNAGYDIVVADNYYNSCPEALKRVREITGKVCKAPEREYGKTVVDLDTTSPLFDGLPNQNVCWMRHNDYNEQAAPGFDIIAYTP